MVSYTQFYCSYGHMVTYTIEEIYVLKLFDSVGMIGASIWIIYELFSDATYSWNNQYYQSTSSFLTSYPKEPA